MRNSSIKISIVFVKIFIFILSNSSFSIAVDIPNSLTFLESPTVKINIEPNTIIYEGDIINCTITGNPTSMYWSINNQSKHTTFYGNDPIIFDPEPTPLDTDYVNLTVYSENSFGNDSDTIEVMIKQIYFGDIHWHSTLCDGDYPLDIMYKNAIKDNYLDFVAYSGHAEFINGLDSCRLRVIIRNILQCLMFWRDEWKTIKEKANKYYDKGNFTTFLAYEWSAGPEMLAETNKVRTDGRMSVISISTIRMYIQMHLNYLLINIYI